MTLHRGLMLMMGGKKAAAPPAIPWQLTGGISQANCIGSYSPEGAANLAASYLNTNNPGTHDAFLGAVPGWNATDGWIGDGTGKYLKTDIVPTATYSAIVKFKNATLANLCVFGRVTGGDFLIFPNTSGGVIYRDGGTTTVSPGLVSGILAITPGKGWRNGVSEATIAAGSGVNAGDAIYLLGRNNSGASAFFGGSLQKIAFYNIDITSYVPGLVTAMGG